MKSAQRYCIVLVTAPNLATARKLVRSALEARLVACGNIVPRLESRYWWQGKIERSAEVLILFKAARGTLPRLERVIMDKHPYDTPEIIVLRLDQGSARYLQWIKASVLPIAR
jgi:periplasmic divalent cation tolerance protein